MSYQQSYLFGENAITKCVENPSKFKVNLLLCLSTHICPKHVLVSTTMRPPEVLWATRNLRFAGLDLVEAGFM